MGQALGILIILLGVVCVTLVIVYSLVQIMGKSNAKKILQYGKDREFFIYEMLSSAFVGGTVMRNLYFPVPTKEGTFSTEVDIVCVTRGGIAVIEVKGMKGNINCPPEGPWVQRYGKKLLPFENPYKQNEGHVNAVRRALNLKGITNVPIRNYVVFTDTQVQFSHRYPWLLRSNELLNALERFDDKLILTRRDQRIISQIMRNHRRRRYPTFSQKQQAQKQKTRRK